MECLEYTLILDLIVARKMPAFCLGCLGCLKCLVPSFVPVLGSLAVTFFMVSWFDYKVLPTSPTLPSKLIKCFFSPPGPANASDCHSSGFPLLSSLPSSPIQLVLPVKSSPSVRNIRSTTRDIRDEVRGNGMNVFSPLSLYRLPVWLSSVFSYEIDLSPCVLQLFGQRAVK